MSDRGLIATDGGLIRTARSIAAYLLNPAYTLGLCIEAAMLVSTASRRRVPDATGSVVEQKVTLPVVAIVIMFVA